MEADVRSRDTLSNHNLPERLTERDLAALWRVSERTLQRWRSQGCGPDWMRIGSRILYSRATVLAFEDQHRNGRAPS
jgi:hypothetical protein